MVNCPCVIRMGLDMPLVSLVSELEPRLRMSGKELIEDSMKPRNIINFSADVLGWYVMAIEKCGYPGLYIEENAYDKAGVKLHNHYALMRVGDYDMTEFWHIFDELRETHPVCPEVSIQDVMLGQSTECLKLIDEMSANAEARAAKYDEMLHRMHINLSVTG